MNRTKIKALRKSQYKSLQDIQDVTGLSKSTINQAERGLSNPTLSTLKKLAKALNVAVEELME